MIRTIAILGGGGSFGIQTAFYLLKQSTLNKVIGIGRNPLRPEPFSLNIDKEKNYQYNTYHLTYELDLLLELLDEEQPDVIINFAAQGEGAVSWKNSWRFFETNCVGLTKLVEELQKRPYWDHFIQIGTSEMYGSVDVPAKEDDPIQPSSPYAASKVAFDMYLMSMAKFKHLPMTILRPSNCYCPGQLLHRIIPKTIISGLMGRKIPLHGGGTAKKSYLHARDLAQAIDLVIHNRDISLDKVYNVGPDEPTSIREVVERCAKALGMPFDSLVNEAPDRLGQDSQYWLDSSAIKNDLDWKQTINWDAGLIQMVNWGKKYFHDLRGVSQDYVMRG